MPFASLAEPVLKDVMGHELLHPGKPLQADWFREYELSDGQVLDLSQCAVHWYFQRGNVWVPYSEEDR
jgi:hypothetical protein